MKKHYFCLVWVLWISNIFEKEMPKYKTTHLIIIVTFLKVGKPLKSEKIIFRSNNRKNVRIEKGNWLSTSKELHSFNDLIK